MNCLKKLLALMLATLCLGLAGCAQPVYEPAPEEKITALVSEGLASLKGGDYATAITALDEALELEPTNPEACNGLLEARKLALDSAPEGDETTAAVYALIEAYGRLYALGEFGASEYIELARLYSLINQSAGRRDALERALRLEPGQETADELFEIVVDLSTDQPETLAEGRGLYELLATGDLDGAAERLLAPGWIETMMPKLTAGRRRYTLNGEDGGLMKLEVGYEGGGAATRVWFTPAGGKTTVMRAEGGSLCAATVSLEGGSYNGPFTSELCDAEGGVYFTEGSFADNLCTGTLDEQAGSLDAELSLAERWLARGECDKTTYSGTFGEGGATAEKQQTAAGSEGGVVYAYDSSARRYLALYPEALPEEGDYAFSCSSFSIPEYPDWLAAELTPLPEPEPAEEQEG